jgi:hypothetical protein
VPVSQYLLADPDFKINRDHDPAENILRKNQIPVVRIPATRPWPLSPTFDRSSDQEEEKKPSGFFNR